MEFAAVILFGYLLGTLSPSALISKVKKTNLKEVGTHNLGATNTMLTFGKAYGALVMLFDIAKAFAAVKLTELIFPDVAYIGLVAGCAAVIGHIHPFYLKFKGGKGLAAYGGLVLAFDPWIFLILLGVALILMFIVNYSFIMPYSAAVLFPILSFLKTGNWIVFTFTLAVSALIAFKHRDNLIKASRGEDIQIRGYFKKHFLHR